MACDTHTQFGFAAEIIYMSFFMLLLRLSNAAVPCPDFLHDLCGLRWTIVTGGGGSSDDPAELFGKQNM